MPDYGKYSLIYKLSYPYYAIISKNFAGKKLAHPYYWNTFFAVEEH